SDKGLDIRAADWLRHLVALRLHINARQTERITVKHLDLISDVVPAHITHNNITDLPIDRELTLTYRRPSRNNPPSEASTGTRVKQRVWRSQKNMTTHHEQLKGHADAPQRNSSKCPSRR